MSGYGVDLGTELGATMSVEKANILLVDDRPENLLALEAILEPLGQNLVRAGSGEEALKHLLDEEFAVILLDVQMPEGMSGFETAEYIKQREKTRRIPIIFLTAATISPEHMFRGYETGAVDFLLKPFAPEVLRSKVSVFVDLHLLKREADKLAHRALHDPLTGLSNRTLFMDRLHLALAHLERRPGQVAVLFFDLDGFKQVNDRYGHEVGDQLLSQMADRLRQALRPCDTLARFGGDEFMILCEDLTDEHSAVLIAERVAEAISEPAEVGGETCCITTSTGITVADDPSRSPAMLIRDADVAMYRAKQRGKACFELFHSGTDRRSSGALLGDGSPQDQEASLSA